MTYGRKEIEKLIDKAVQAHDSQDSLRFSQSAENAAHALLKLQNIEFNEKNPETLNT